MLSATLPGRPTTFRSLTLYPLLCREEAARPYLLLADALRAGTLTITEVGGGSVPELLASNQGAEDVLILDGEQLVGARQNRTTSRSLLIAGRSEVKIPVSCMEQGRWHHVSHAFQPGAYNSPAKVRRHARRSESGHAAEGRPPTPEVLAEAQGQVWEEIAKTASFLRAHSGTQALNEMYDQRADDLAEWAEAFPARPGQVGTLAFLGDRPLGMDVLGDSGLYSRIHPRLVMGYAMDAISESASAHDLPPRDAEAEDYLSRVRSARRTEAPTTGKGAYRVLSGGVVGAELADEGWLVHLSAFPAGEPGPRPGRADAAPIAPPSQRRRPE